jgi:hypothetical protein
MKMLYKRLNRTSLSRRMLYGFRGISRDGIFAARGLTG